MANKIIPFDDKRECDKCGNAEVRMNYFAKCGRHEMCYPYALRKIKEEHILVTCTRCHCQWIMEPKKGASHD